MIWIDEQIKAMFTRLGKNMPKPVGFWFDKYDLLSSFPSPQSLVDRSWNKHERRVVLEYVRSGKVLISCLGYSFCRFECGIQDPDMGNMDLTDGTWVWPEGFAHYIEKHDVKPPAEFVSHVLLQTGRKP